MFVVVLYKMDMAASPTIRRLSEQRAVLGARGIRVLVVDNTPGEQAASLTIDSGIEYIAIGDNKGLANAYQIGFRMAKADEYRFLVLLDQDSEVDSGFIAALDGVARDPDPTVGIWCPNVISCGTQISPYTQSVFGWPNFFPSRCSSRLYGINSFSVVNVRCIEAIGGFDQFYWLDCLDSWLYERAQQSGWAVKRLGVTVEHDLSLVSGKISLARMKNMAFYESCFVLEYGLIGRIAGTILRLVVRGLKRVKMIGGFCNYGSYLCEIFKGIGIGLKRRRSRAA
jgi:GT2 family glycosyltransferase